jgi:hypothetical protein
VPLDERLGVLGRCTQPPVRQPILWHCVLCYTSSCDGIDALRVYIHGRATTREVLDKIDGGRDDLEGEEAYKQAVWLAFSLQERNSRCRDEASDPANAKRLKN